MKNNEQIILNRKKRRYIKNSEKELYLDITLKEFLLNIDFLKQTPDYEQKGPFNYCVVQRDLNFPILSFF